MKDNEIHKINECNILKNTIIENDITKQQKYNKIMADFEESQRYADYKELNIDKEYWHKRDFDSYHPQNASQIAALIAIKDMIKTKQGEIILTGSYGLGKTHLASIVAMKLYGYVYKMSEIIAMIRSSYLSNKTICEYDILRKLATTPFLCIDELGRTKGSEAERNWLSYIIDKRHANYLPTIIITNRKRKIDCVTEEESAYCFEKYVNGDVMSRLHNATWLQMDGKDYREIQRCNLQKS